jgi:hypothetical protein
MQRLPVITKDGSHTISIPEMLRGMKTINDI